MIPAPTLGLSRKKASRQRAAMAPAPQILQIRVRRPVLKARRPKGKEAKKPTRRIREPERPESWKGKERIYTPEKYFLKFLILNFTFSYCNFRIFSCYLKCVFLFWNRCCLCKLQGFFFFCKTCSMDKSLCLDNKNFHSSTFPHLVGVPPGAHDLLYLG